MKVFRSTLFLFAVVVAASLALNAQQQFGVLNGVVHDQTGAVITGADVTVTADGVQPITGKTNTSGEYAFPKVPAGTYTIIVKAEGFKEAKTEYVIVSAGETTPIEVTVEPKGAETKVEVVAENKQQVETESNEQAGLITEKEVVTYGLNGRNFSQLIALAPGVSNQTGQDEAKVGVTGSAKYSVNGGRVEYNAFDVDGSDVLNTGINASKGKSMPLIVYPSLDAIQEVKVLTSNYGAQYGRSASGSVVVTTKSGGDKFHGNAYEFLRNEFFNSRNYFDQTAHAPLYRKNDFGGTFGGPLYIPGVFNSNKDRTFFFFSEEVRIEKSPENGQFTQAVPSNMERGLTVDGKPLQIGNGSVYGDFSDICGVDPQDCPIYAGQPFNINQVPISGFAQTMLQSGLIPLAVPGAICNSPSGSCYAATVSPKTTWREELFRIDHTLVKGATKNTKLGFRFIHDAWQTQMLSPQWGAVQVNSFPTVLNNFNGPGLSMVARLDQVLSPTLLSQFSVSYTDTHITLSDQGGAGVSLTRPKTSGSNISPLDTNCVQEYMAQNSKADRTPCLGYIFTPSINGQLFGGKLPGLYIAGNNAAYGGVGMAVDTSFMPWDHRNPTWDFRESLSKVLGRHTVQAGVQFIYVRQSETNAATGANTGDVQGLLTFNNMNNYNSTGNAFADFLFGPGCPTPQSCNGDQSSGKIRTYQQDSAQQLYHLHYFVTEPYVQDDWKVSPRLTVNIGLRVSIFQNWQMRQGEAYNWEPGFYNAAMGLNTEIDSISGQLLNRSTGNPIPIDLNNLDAHITNGIVECGTHGTPSSCMASHIFNTAPRVGFAWDPTGEGKTSIRAGYGVFFEHGTSSESNVGSLIGNAPRVLNVTQNFPQSYDAIGNRNPNFGATGAWPINVTSIPTTAIWPYVQQWSLGVQRQVSKDTMISAAYVGSKGTHLTVEEQINQLAPVPDSVNPFIPGQPLTRSICSGFSSGEFIVGGYPVRAGDPAYANLEAACFGAKQGLIPDVNSLRQMAPGIGSIYSLKNIASSVYSAFQFTAQHNHGPLSAGVSYSYSHAIDSASGRYSATFVDAYNLARNRASSDFDLRHILNINYVYKLPLLNWYADLWKTTHCVSGDDPNGACAQPGAVQSYVEPGSIAKSIFTGWNISGITMIQSGTPFSVINRGTVLDNAGLALGLDADSYPDKLSGQQCNLAGSQNNTIGPVIGNPCNFVAPRGLTQGNAGRNSLNNPGRVNFDTALFRQGKVMGERATLEFRAEVFNLFNHTQFRIFNPDKGNTASNTVSCYGGINNSAGDSSCLAGNGFLHPVDAHRPRTMQFGLKLGF